MSLTYGKTYIDVEANLDPLRRDMRYAETLATRSGRDIGTKMRTGISSRMSGIGSMVGSALRGAAFAGVAAVAAGVGASIKAAVEAQKVAAQTEAVIKSTGGAANVTAEHVSDLANKIMRYSGISDEAVASAANMLMSFTNIRQEVGKNNDIFDQATKAVADMATFMGTDMQSAAVQVGKALNDPIRGVTALSRAGVQFTEEQRDQIEALVESGKTMEAQKVIIAELETQFGGSARAMGKTAEGQFNIAKEAIGNAGEAIGTALLPMIGTLSKRLARFVNSDEFQDWLEGATEWLQKWVPKAVGWAVDAVQWFGKEWRLLKKDFGDTIDWITNALATFVGWTTDLLGKILAAAAFAFSWNDEIGPKLATLRDKFNTWADSIVGDITRIGDKANMMGEELVDIDKLLKGFSDVDVAVHFRAANMPSGDGPGMAGTPTAWAQAAMSSVAGFQTITSGYRPWDKGSYHSRRPPWNAVDIGGENLSAIFNTLAARYGGQVNELIGGHTMIRKGVRSYYAPNDHPFTGRNAHIHVADTGARVQGPALVRIGNIKEDVHFIPRSGPGAVKPLERDNGPQHMTIELHVDGTVLAKTVTRHQRRLRVLLGDG